MTRETRIFNRVFRQWNPSSPPPQFDIQYYPYTALTHTIRLRHNRLKVRLSHLFKSAPDAVIDSVAHILFSKLYQHRTPAEALNHYHRFVEKNQSNFRSLLRGGGPKGPTTHQPQGHHLDLERVFDHVNRRYFHPALEKPLLAWSRQRGHSKLGEYQSLQHRIIINRRFDDDQIPPYVLDYLMFHEMLHMKYGAEIRNGRRVVHTGAFRKAEQQFRDYSKAREWIRRMTRQREWRDSSRAF